MASICPSKIFIRDTSNTSSATRLANKLVTTTGSLRSSTGPKGLTGDKGDQGEKGEPGIASNVTGSSPAFVQFGSVPIRGLQLSKEVLIPKLSSKPFFASFSQSFVSRPTVICTVSGAVGIAVSLNIVTNSTFSGFITNTTSFNMLCKPDVQYFALA